MTEEKPQTANPYLDTQRVWLERYGTHIQQAYNWRLLALIEAIALCSAIFGLIYVACQSKYIPYVVAVDKIGVPIGVKIADRAGPTDDRVVRAMLATWVETARTVATDAEVDKNDIDRVYAMVAPESEAKTYLDSWYSGGHSPFDEAKSQTRSAQIAFVLPISDQSWQVQWLETVRDNDGRVTGKEQWVATIGVAFHVPQDESSLLQNPIGLYITTLSWTRKL